MKGSDPIEIRAPPVLQVSLDITVSVDEFFLRNLIENLAYILNIDKSRIRIVNIIAEDSRRRRQAINDTNVVVLELGNPPELNVTEPEVVPVEEDWLEGNGETDSVDVEVSSGVTHRHNVSVVGRGE